MATPSRIGRGLLLVVGTLVALVIGGLIAVTVLGVTAAGVCAVAWDPNCNDEPNYSAVTVFVEDGADGATLVMHGERNPVLPDAYVGNPWETEPDTSRLTSVDAASDTFRFAVERAPQPGESMPIELRLRFGGRSGIDGCAERGTGMHYDTVVGLQLHRDQDGTLTVSDVDASSSHDPGYF